MNNNKLSELIKYIECKYNIKIKIYSSSYFKKITGSKHTVAFTRCFNSEIYINRKILKYSKSFILRAVLHECGHVYCYRNGLFKKYHVTSFINISDENKRLKILTALKAERYVDKWAAKELKKIDGRMKYDFPYSQKNNIKIFKKLYMKNFE